MRVGYFGGTFDPPHSAHVRFATLAADRFALDEVYMAPTGLQPLKQHPPEASFEDRLAMVKLLCGVDSRLQASDIDAPHQDGTPNYTVDALTALKQMHGEAQLFALVGADSFQTVRQWREPDRLLSLAEWIVMSRPGSALDLASFTSLPEEHSRIHRMDDMNESLSSTELRNRLRAGVSCGAALPAAVMLYISRMHLYHAAPRSRPYSATILP